MALDFMRARRAPLHLVIFDCDGVLVDSEPVANRVVAEELTLLGWPMDGHTAEVTFLGMSFPDMLPLIEARTGRGLDAAWQDRLVARVIAAMAAEVTAIPGAVEALHATAALGLPWRVASNSSHAEMAVKFARLGVTDLVAGRLHSFDDVPRAKPAPDLFLAAAAAEGIDPAHCVVVEDSATGARAAAAAGMPCLGYAPHGDGGHLAAVGAAPFRSMFDLPALLAAGRGTG